MSIIINSIKHFPVDFYPASDTPNLLGNTTDRIRTEIDFTVAEKRTVRPTTSNDSEVIQGDNGTDTDSVTADYSETFNGSFTPFFEDFHVGALVKISGNIVGGGAFSTTKEIIEKISDGKVRFDSVFVAPSQGRSVDALHELVTPFKAFTFQYGVIENNESLNFNSKIDDGDQKYELAYLDTAVSGVANSLQYVGNVENQNGSATITRVTTGTNSGDQRFTIKHTHDIDPVVIPQRYNDELAGITPFDNEQARCLKYVFKIEAQEELTNPNFIQTITKEDLLGNTGWKDEKFNQGINNYSVANVVFKRDATGDVIDNLELTADVNRVEFSVLNTVDAPFLNGSTEFLPHLSIIPQLIDEITGNGNELKDNFYIDRGLQTVGSATITGDNGIITSIVATFISTSQIDVALKITMSAPMVADLIARERRAYKLTFSVQNHLLTIENSDRVTLGVSSHDMFVDNSDPNMIIINRNFLDLTETDFATEGSLTVDAKKEDVLISEFQFFIDRTGRVANDIDISKIKLEIIGQKTDLTEFIFESWTSSVQNSNYVSNGFWNNQYFDETEDRPYKMPRKEIILKRREDLDSGNLIGYSLQYPFIIKYEEWIENTVVNTDMFDLTAENNGLNYNWDRTSNTTNWDVYIRLTVEATKDDELLVYTDESIMLIDTYEENASWINENITIKDGSGNVIPLLLTGEDCYITATKEYTGGSLPLPTDVHWWAHIQENLGNGASTMSWITSLYDYLDDSLFSSIDTSNKVVKTVVGNVFKADYMIKANTLQDGVSYDLSARLFNNNIVLGDKKMEDTVTYKKKEDGTTYKIRN